MKYLLIDTNIYIQCCLLELEGDDHDVLKKLYSLLEQNKLTLLLPEIVELEFDKAVQEKFEAIKDKIGEYKEAINKDTELDSKVKKDLIAKLTECSDERAKNKTNVRQTIDKIFQHKNTERIKLSTAAMADAYRRFLANKKPYSRKEHGQIQPDCLLVEAANDYLQDKTDYDFLLCSFNKRDFADNPDEKENKIIVANDIGSSFINIKYYVTLFQCLNENFQTKYPKEVIEKASSAFYQPAKMNVSYPSILGGASVDPRYYATPINLGAASPNLVNMGTLVNPAVNMGVPTNTFQPNVNEGLTAVGIKTCAKCGKPHTPPGLYNSHMLFTVNDNYCDECKAKL